MSRLLKGITHILPTFCLNSTNLSITEGRSGSESWSELFIKEHSAFAVPDCCLCVSVDVDVKSSLKPNHPYFSSILSLIAILLIKPLFMIDLNQVG